MIVGFHGGAGNCIHKLSVHAIPVRNDLGLDGTYMPLEQLPKEGEIESQEV